MYLSLESIIVEEDKTIIGDNKVIYKLVSHLRWFEKSLPKNCTEIPTVVSIDNTNWLV